MTQFTRLLFNLPVSKRDTMNFLILLMEKKL